MPYLLVHGNNNTGLYHLDICICPVNTGTYLVLARLLFNEVPFNQQAFDVLTSSRLLEALDLEKEDPRIRERYGEGTPQHQGDAAPRLMGQFLLARRLVEAGVRCVTVSFSFWDWHGGNFKRGRDNLPPFDQGVSALVEDLHQRGLDKDVTVIAWGEFGRTPKINKDGGRDHWPRVSSALMAGGGMRTGHVDWHYQSTGRRAQGTTDSLPGSLRHPLPQLGH